MIFSIFLSDFSTLSITIEFLLILILLFDDYLVKTLLLLLYFFGSNSLILGLVIILDGKIYPYKLVFC